MNDKGPYVAVAVICERVLHETDGGISCIRLTDTIALEVASDDAPSLFPVIYQGMALVSFRSGDYVGPMTLRIEFRNPSGKEGKPPQEHLLQFQGGEHGTNLIIRLNLQLDEEGLYYLDLFLADHLKTRIPLRVRVTRKDIQPKN